MNVLAAELFQPFRITLTNGKTDQINYPDVVKPGHVTFHLSLWWSDDEEEAKMSEQRLPFELIESIEPLTSSSEQDQPQN